ncbi:MAG: hypothetical protein GY716_02695 [bacterium]|nr:hypothetical protein [bacterium]
MLERLRSPIPAVLWALTALLANSGSIAEEPGTVERVGSLLGEQRWREALELARAGHASRPDDPGVTAALAEALLRAGRLEEIAPLLEPLAEDGACGPRGLMVLGRLRDAEGRDGEAVQLLQAAAAAAPDDRDVLYWAAQSAPSRERAVELFRRYLELSEGDDPDRIEAAEGGTRLFETLGERAIWTARERPERVELPLTMIWSPDSGAVNGYVIRVKLGERGKPVPLLLDSGSPGLLVLHRVARKSGFERLATTTSFGGGGDRKQRGGRGLFPAIDIGGLSFTDVLATSIDRELDATGRFRGLIGLSAFNGYRITLDLEHRRLLLEPGGAELDGSPYWNVDGQWVVRASLAGNDRDGLFLFDSGATNTMVSFDLVRDLPRAHLGEAIGVHGVGGKYEGVRALGGVEVRFQDASARGSLRATDLSVRSRIGGVEIGGFLGLDALAGRRIVIDTVQRKVRISGGRGGRGAS